MVSGSWEAASSESALCEMEEGGLSSSFFGVLVFLIPSHMGLWIIPALQEQHSCRSDPQAE